MPERAGEFDLIERYFRPLAAAPEALGLTDDAALLTPKPGFELAVSTDAIVAGVHYLASDTPETAAARLIASNLSDLAAMGARPLGFTLACAWPNATAENWIAAFAAELGRWIARFSFPLLGGDTVATPGPAVFSLTAIGEVEAGRALRRSGAKAGGRGFVTGTIGDAALGLRVAKGEANGLPAPVRDFLLRRFRAPEPRVAAGRALIETARIGQIGGAIDISDGLVQDFGHVARASKVGIDIDAALVPLSDAAKAALAAGL
ncbi:MAG: thiamine-phosphate kinase, partial [Proteobacteria bacterium]|nr:thiamine-phosphate kinase [Pseudomonadota bacterium]